jgi:hypothetical protein
MTSSLKPQSIVIVSQGHPPLGRYLADAFKVQCIQATVFSTDQNTWFDKWVIHPVNKQLHNLRILPKGKNVLTNHRWAHRNYLETQFQKLLDAQQPDLILAVRGSTYCETTLQNCRAVKFGWWVEPANRVHEVLNELPVFDWCYSMNEESLDRFREQGYTACSYMPHMFSDQEFYPLEGEGKTIDAVFVGNWNPRRQRYIDAAMEVTDNIVLYGKDWLKKNWRNPRYWRAWKGKLIQGAPLNRLYNQAKVVLNITQWETGTGGQASGMNMRFFEVPATGSLFMTDRVAEADALFAANQDFLDFGDVTDFRQRFREILQDGIRRQAIASHGYQTVCKTGASYQNMVNDILQRYAVSRSADVTNSQENK